MKRPFIYTHILTSLDGKIWGEFTKLIFACRLYYFLHLLSPSYYFTYFPFLTHTCSVVLA